MLSIIILSLIHLFSYYILCHAFLFIIRYLLCDVFVSMESFVEKFGFPLFPLCMLTEDTQNSNHNGKFLLLKLKSIKFYSLDEMINYVFCNNIGKFHIIYIYNIHTYWYIYTYEFKIINKNKYIRRGRKIKKQ